MKKRNKVLALGLTATMVATAWQAAEAETAVPAAAQVAGIPRQG